MSHDSHFAGDLATFADTYEDVYEVECDCGWVGEVPCQKEQKHGVMYIYAEWKCPSCEETHTTETDFEYDGNDY